jgi:hypothetical protein
MRQQLASVKFPIAQIGGPAREAKFREIVQTIHTHENCLEVTWFYFA